MVGLDAQSRLEAGSHGSIDAAFAQQIRWLSVWNPYTSEELCSNRRKAKVVYLEFHWIASLFCVPANRLSRVEGSNGQLIISERSLEGSNNRDLSSVHGGPT